MVNHLFAQRAFARWALMVNGVSAPFIQCNVKSNGAHYERIRLGLETMLLLLLLCAAIAAITVRSLILARRTGRIASRGWTFDRKSSPTAFWLIYAVNVGILALCVFFALRLMGLVGALPASITVRLPGVG